MAFPGGLQLKPRCPLSRWEAAHHLVCRTTHSGFRRSAGWFVRPFSSCPGSVLDLQALIASPERRVPGLCFLVQSGKERNASISGLQRLWAAGKTQGIILLAVRTEGMDAVSTDKNSLHMALDARFWFIRLLFKNHPSCLSILLMT